MNQPDKDAIVKEASAKAIEQIAQALKIEPTLESVTPAMEFAMGSDVMRLYKLSLYFGIEGDACFERTAYFASCLLDSCCN